MCCFWNCHLFGVKEFQVTLTIQDLGTFVFFTMELPPSLRPTLRLSLPPSVPPYLPPYLPPGLR